MAITDKRTCWEIAVSIERSLKGFGMDDNCPFPEMALEEQAILQHLESCIQQTKSQLNLCAKVRDENDGRIPYAYLWGN